MSKRTQHMRYESEDTWQLYQEFCNITGNKMDVTLPAGMTMTTQRMHDILNSAYKLVGRPEMTRSH
ncbi:MAG: hypothetical protein KH304_06890 [Clostridium sp.]|uniref:hypothetical protein n=1 Tax=Clostridia TaxID=186801 RepID=UPI00067ED974|nr:MULTISPECIES: hypothetical protein [Clostridia]MBS6763295.1 hypothetical protein [Clostridium sp.]